MKVKQFDNPSTNCKQLSHFQIDFQASQKGKETVKSEETFKTPLSIDFETGIMILSSHGWDDRNWKTWHGSITLGWLLLLLSTGLVPHFVEDYTASSQSSKIKDLKIERRRTSINRKKLSVSQLKILILYEKL